MQGLENSSVGRLFRPLFGPFKFPIPLFAGIQRRVFNGVYGFSDLFLGPIPNRNRQSLCVAAKLAAEHLLERNLKTQRGYR